MPMDTFVIIINTYDNTDDALADYDAARTLYQSWDLGDTYDAAVVTRRDDGKVRIVKRHEQPVVQGGVAGLGIGLAVGALSALFPAVVIGTGLAWGAGGGLVLGALTGHVVGGVSRKDLKELGEELDSGQSAVLIVAAEDVEARVDAALSRGNKILKKQLKADNKELEKAIAEAKAEHSAA